ncbi:hypothetical protein ACFLTE_08530 [Bacteroidota bacterium]
MAIEVVIHADEEVSAGERLYFQVEIKYPENPSGRVDLYLDYVVEKDGEVVAKSRAIKSVEFQTSFRDFVVIPKGAEKGEYAIEVVMQDYEDLGEQSRATFYVVSGEIGEIKMYLFIGLGGVILIVVIVIVFIFLARRKKG